MTTLAVEQDTGEARGHPAFMSIPLTTLCASASLTVDVYLKTNENSLPVLYREREYPMSIDDIDQLTEQGIRVAYIRTKAAADYQSYLRDNLQTYLLQEDVPAPRRFEFLSETARDLLSESFDHGNTEVILQTTAELGDRMVDMVTGHELLASDMFSILRHDYKTFTHSFNTASFCLLLAKGLGISQTDQLKQIALGALLHDVGKLQIPGLILNKKGRLTDEERQVIQRHPVDGFALLCERNDLSFGQLMMIYQHHERLDGRGYPVGESGNDIHFLARLCSVADIFEAMTSHRPYRAAIPVPEVLVYLDKQAHDALDQEIVQCWKATVATR